MKIKHFTVINDTVELIPDAQQFLDYVDDPYYYRYLEYLEDIDFTNDIFVYFVHYRNVSVNVWQILTNENTRRYYLHEDGYFIMVICCE